MAGSTIDSIINFIVPIAVWIFLAWIIYKIPIVKEGVDKLRAWNERRKNNVGGGSEEAVSIKSITYE